MPPILQKIHPFNTYHVMYRNLVTYLFVNEAFKWFKLMFFIMIWRMCCLSCSTYNKACIKLLLLSTLLLHVSNFIRVVLKFLEHRFKWNYDVILSKLKKKMKSKAYWKYIFKISDNFFFILKIILLKLLIIFRVDFLAIHNTFLYFNWIKCDIIKIMEFPMKR